MAIKAEMDMTTGNIFKKMFFYSLPLMLTGVFQLLYTAADLIIVGNFTDPLSHAVGAISATTSLISLILNLVMGLAVGANVVVGRAYGAKNKRAGDRALHTSVALALVSGLSIMVVGLIIARPVLELMKTPSDIIDLSDQYLFIYFIGAPFLIIYNFGASIMRGIGDTKKPFYFLVVAGIVNVLLNLLFVVALNMSVAGVALATIISEAVSASLVVISLMRNKGFAHLELRKIKFHKNEVKMIIQIGLPSGIQGALFSISNVIIQSAVNGFGASADTGNGAAGNLTGMLYVVMNSFSQAGMAFVAANFGAKNIPNIKRSIKYSIMYSVVTSYTLCLILYLVRYNILGWYTSDPVAIEIGAQKLQTFLYCFFFFGFLNTIGFCERGLGYSMLPMFISLIGICGFRILYIYTFFQIEEYHTIFYLYLSYPLSWAITAIVTLIAYLFIRKEAFARVLEDRTISETN